MSAYIYGLIYTIIYTVMCNLFGAVWLEKKRLQGNTRYLFCMLLWIVLEFGISALFDQYVILKMAVVIFADVLFLRIFYEASAMKAFGISFLYQVICLLSDYFVFIIARKIVGGIHLVSSARNVTGYLIGTLSQILIILIVIWFQNQFGSEREHSMTKKEWMKFMTFPFFSMITILAFAVNFDEPVTQGQENTILFVVLGLALMNVFVFYLILDIIQRETGRKREELLLEHAAQTERMYQQEKKRYEELQRQRHEYRNQMLVIQALMEKKDYGRIAEYIQNYCGEVEKKDWFDTNHAVVNAVLNLKYMDALSKNILMIVRFNDLSGIPLKDTDIISVLSNLLDNAIEASEKCEDKTPLIKVKFVEENGKIILAVSNIWNGKLKWQDGKMISSKKDGKVHGYGVDNVKRIVKKYQGVYTIDREGDMFQVVVSIPI